jgi:tripartite-type tricarboxylate transporter receptor subunit TctC
MKFATRAVLRAAALASVAFAASLFAASLASAQTSGWPSRPITIIVPFPPGASTDSAARLIRDHLSERLGQPVVVENRPGANGTAGSSTLVNSAPDGYTLLVTVNAPITMNPHIQKNFPFDAMKGFSPIIRIADIILTLAVTASLPVNTVQELIDYARKNPDKKLSFGSAGIGSTHHIAGELLNLKTGINMVHVPYRGGAPAIQDLVAGHIPVSFGTTPAVLPQAQAGTIRILAIVEHQRSADLPGVPTVAETVPGVVSNTWVGLFAPAGTPKPIIERINGIVAEAVKKPDIIAKLKQQGATAAGGTSEELEKAMREEYEHWGKLIPAIGLTPQ